MVCANAYHSGAFGHMEYSSCDKQASEKKKTLNGNLMTKGIGHYTFICQSTINKSHKKLQNEQCGLGQIKGSISTEKTARKSGAI